MNRTCEWCGAGFTATPSVVAAGNGRFCSRSCSGQRRRAPVERICGTCGKTFSVKPAEVAKGKGLYCSHPCYALGKRGPRREGVRHRMMKAKGHPVAPPSGGVAISRVRLYDAIGPGPHSCHWCGRAVEWRVGEGVRVSAALLVDHLDHDPTNDELANLVPSCNPCNSHRRESGVGAIIQPGELTFVKGDGTRTRGVERRCEECGGAFVASATEARNPRKSRFCSKSCAGKGRLHDRGGRIS